MLIRPQVIKTKIPKILLPIQVSAQSLPVRMMPKMPISQQSTVLTTLEYPPSSQNVLLQNHNFSADKAINDVYNNK